MLELVQALIDTAESDNDIAMVGAGPLEDLMSHSGHGLKLIDDVERRARQQPRFRNAVGGMWLSDEAPPKFAQDLASSARRTQQVVRCNNNLKAWIPAAA